MVIDALSSIATSPEATSALVAASKGATSTIVKSFFTRVLEPFFKKRKVKSELVSDLRKYIKLTEKTSRNVPTIAIQGSVFALDEIYEPLVLIRSGDQKEFEVDRFPSQIISRSSCSLIVDAAGMGKSTLTKFVLRRSLAELEFIPIMIELRKMKAGEVLTEFICDQIIGNNSSVDARAELLNCFEDGQFLFMFDGYDEIEDSLRPFISADILKMSCVYSDCGFWLTSRPDSALASFSSFAEFQIKPLTVDKAYSLLRRYDGSRGKASALIAAIKYKPQVSDFLGNPLLVTLLYKAYDYKATVPLKRNIFFRQVYEALYQDHDLSKPGTFDRKKKSNLDVDDFHKALRSLGIITFTESGVQYGSETFTKLLNKAAELASSLDIDVGKWKQDLTSAVPVFVKDGTDVRWAHKAFQDYFIAQFAFCDMGDRKQKFVHRLLTDRNPERYQNILVLIAELDIELLRLAFLREFLTQYRDEFLSECASEREVEFALFGLNKCADFYVVKGSGQWLKRDVVEGRKFIDELREFVDETRRTRGSGPRFTRASVSSSGDFSVVVVHKSSFSSNLQFFSAIDPTAFASAPFLTRDESSRDGMSAWEERCEKNGWCCVNDLVLNSKDESERESLVRFMFRELGFGISSLASVDAIVSNDENEKRNARIDDLLGNMSV